MSDAETGRIRERTREEKLRALVKRDIDPEITRLAENALKRRAESSDQRSAADSDPGVSSS